MSTERSLLFGLIRRGPSITAKLNLTNVDDFRAAADLVPYTIGCTGLNGRGRIVYSVNDTGTSAAFRLTASEAEQARRMLAAVGVDPATLTLMPPRRGG